MTRDTLLFLRGLLDRVTLQTSDPDFKANALAIIAAIDELDKEIANLSGEES